jgi:hypothetical protein
MRHVLRRRKNGWNALPMAGSIGRSSIRSLSALLTDDFVRGGTDDVRAYGRPAQLIPFDIRTNAEGVATFYRVRYPAAALTWILRTPLTISERAPAAK